MVSHMIAFPHPVNLIRLNTESKWLLWFHLSNSKSTVLSSHWPLFLEVFCGDIGFFSAVCNLNPLTAAFMDTFTHPPPPPPPLLVWIDCDQTLSGKRLALSQSGEHNEAAEAQNKKTWVWISLYCSFYTVSVWLCFLYFYIYRSLYQNLSGWIHWQKSFFFFSCSTVRWNQLPCPLNRLAHMLCVWAASVIVWRATLRNRADPSGRPEDVGHPSAHMSPPGRSLSFWLPELHWIGEGGSSGGSYLTWRPWL